MSSLESRRENAKFKIFATSQFSQTILVLMCVTTSQEKQNCCSHKRHMASVRHNSRSQIGVNITTATKQTGIERSC